MKAKIAKILTIANVAWAAYLLLIIVLFTIRPFGTEWLIYSETFNPIMLQSLLYAMVVPFVSLVGLAVTWKHRPKHALPLNLIASAVSILIGLWAIKGYLAGMGI